jgi:hypothetical protein
MIALTLEDIMKRFDLPEFIAIKARCEIVRANVRGISATLDSVERKAWLQLLNEINAYCKGAGFDHAAAKAYSIRLRLEKSPEEFTGQILDAQFHGLNEDLEICMFSHRFIQVEDGVKKYLGAVAMFGGVIRAFPSIQSAIQDAGDCIAVDLNTAAVFHLMHVVERGLRALCVNLKVATIKKGFIEYATWDDILKKLPEAVDAKINGMSRGPKKQKAQEFYYPTSKEIRGFKDAWRNHIMHKRTSYTREDALAVFSHVQRFMHGLVTYGIHEV